MSKRELIRSAAVHLFAAQGFGATPTAEIARVAGVAEGTIFRHFQSKQNLIEDIVEGAIDKYTERISSVVQHGACDLDVVDAVIAAHAAMARDMADDIRILLRLSSGEKEAPEQGEHQDVALDLQERSAPLFRNLVSCCMDHKACRADLDAVATGELLHFTCLGILRNYTTPHRDDMALLTAAQTLFRCYLRA